MRSTLLATLALLVACTPADPTLAPELEAAWAEAGPDARLPVLIRSTLPEGVLRAEGVRARRSYDHVPFRLVDIDLREARRLARHDARMVLDGPLLASGRPAFAADPDIVRRAVGADRVHAGTGVDARTGVGVTVALVDSGVWTGHPDLPASSVVAWRDFVDANGDGVGDDDGAVLQDRYGHGTMVASVLVNQRPGMRGVAPDVDLLVARVLDDAGAGTISGAVTAIDWIIGEAPARGVDIVHLSVGAAPRSSFVDDPLAMAADAALRAGLIVVAAAGNHGVAADGEVFGGIVSPATHPGVLAVGATDTWGTASRSDDGVADWSSRGPTAFDGIGKPDVVAPGAAVAVALRPGSRLWSQAKGGPLKHWPGVDTKGTHVMVASGTSFAAPAVTGAIALLLEGHPGLTAIGARAALQITAQDVGDPSLLASGAGQINALGAARLVDFWTARAIGLDPAPPATFDLLEGKVAPWAMHVLWDGWLTTEEDVSWLNDGGVLGVGELGGTGILWDGMQPRYTGVRLSGDGLMSLDFASYDAIWGTGILWDGPGLTRDSSRVWSEPEAWSLRFVWPDHMSPTGAASPLVGTDAPAGLTEPVPDAPDPRPVRPLFEH